MDIKEIVGKKIAIHCNTTRKADILLGKFELNDFFTIESKRERHWYFYGVETCYNIKYKDNKYSYSFEYCDKNWYSDKGYTIIEFEELFEDKQTTGKSNEVLMKEIQEAIEHLKGMNKYLKSENDIYSGRCIELNNIAVQALTEKMERDKECKFCNDNLKYISGEINVGVNNCGYTTGCEQLHYCPMCGRNLN